MNRTVILLLLLSLLFSQNVALPVIGPKSLAEIRGKLPDKAFKMDMKDAIILKNEDYLARFVNVPKNPALTAADVQFNFVDLIIKPGKSFFRHTHPRSAEALFIVKGKLKVSFWFEGVNPRVVTNIVRQNESADPGLIPAPLGDSNSD